MGLSLSAALIVTGVVAVALATLCVACATAEGPRERRSLVYGWGGALAIVAAVSAWCAESPRNNETVPVLAGALLFVLYGTAVRHVTAAARRLDVIEVARPRRLVPRRAFEVVPASPAAPYDGVPQPSRPQ